MSKTTHSHTRRLILKNAGHLFASRGYENTSMQNIAERVGIQKASLYYFFKSKEEIFEAVMENLWSGMAQGLEKLEENFKKTASPPSHYLAEALSYTLKTLTDAGRMALEIDSVHQLSACKKAQVYIKDMRKNLRQFLVSRKVTDPGGSEEVIVCALKGYLLQNRQKAKLPVIKKFCSSLTSLVLQKN